MLILSRMKAFEPIKKERGRPSKVVVDEETREKQVRMKKHISIARRCSLLQDTNKKSNENYRKH